MDFVDAFYWFDSKTFGKNDYIYIYIYIYISHQNKRNTHAFKYIPVRAICSVGWNLMELTVDQGTKMK